MNWGILFTFGFSVAKSKEKGEILPMAKRNHVKDMTEKTLETYGDVYADLMNVLIFGGQEVVSEGDLEQTTGYSVYKVSGEIRDQERDIAKYWNSMGCHIAFVGAENETEPEEDMPLRVIGYDGAAYRDQIKYVTDEKGKRKKLKVPRYPVVTMVLYFGYKKHWKKAKSLHELFGEMPQELMEIVNDYKINVYEIAWLSDEQLASFRSDFRIVAEYFVQMRKTGDYHPLPQVMVHAREVLQLMCVLTDDKRFEQAYNESKEGKEPRTMCEVLDRVENRGLQKGMEEFVSICRKFNMSDEEICFEIMGRFQITKAQAERFMKERC